MSDIPAALYETEMQQYNVTIIIILVKMCEYRKRDEVKEAYSGKECNNLFSILMNSSLVNINNENKKLFPNLWNCVCVLQFYVIYMSLSSLIIVTCLSSGDRATFWLFSSVSNRNSSISLYKMCCSNQVCLSCLISSSACKYQCKNFTSTRLEIL